jgi:hypothetical protein
MSQGTPTMPETVYKAGGNPEKAIERLAKSLERLSGAKSPFHPSPIFGVMTKEQLVRLQLIHCAHHLGFLIPK